MVIKKYSKEFKIDAISLVTEQNYTQTEAANSLGITPKLISRWIKEYKTDEDLPWDFIDIGVCAVGGAD